MPTHLKQQKNRLDPVRWTIYDRNNKKAFRDAVFRFNSF